MIKEVTYYEGICDNCGEQWHNLYGIVAYSEVEKIEESLMNSEWNKLVTPGEMDKHYCPDCYHIDESDEVIIKPTPIQ